MQRNLRFVLLLSLFCRSPSVLAAVDGTLLTLQTAIEEGLKNSQSIQLAELEVRRQGWKKKQTFSEGFMPKLSIGATQYLGIQYSVSIVKGLGNFLGFFPNTVFGAQAHLPLFDGFASVRRWKAASLEAEAAEKDLEEKTFQVKKDIELAFYRVLYAQQYRGYADENVGAIKTHASRIQQFFKEGAARKFDVLRVQVQLGDAEAELLDVEDRILDEREKLSLQMGREGESRTIQGSLPVPDLSEASMGLPGEMTSSRQDLVGLEIQAEAASLVRKTDRTWLTPALSLVGDLSFYNQQSVDFASGSVSNLGQFPVAYNVALNLKWNLFDGGVSYARVHQEEELHHVITKKLELARLRAHQEVQTQRRKVRSSALHYRSRLTDVTRAEESVRIARQEFEAGKRTSSELLDAVVDQFRAKAALLSAQLGAVEAKIKLEQALGRTLNEKGS